MLPLSNVVPGVVVCLLCSPLSSGMGHTSPYFNASMVSLQVSVSGSVGSPLTLTLADADGRSVTADTGDVLLQPAAKRPMSADDVVAAVGQLGDNVLTPESVDVSGLAYKQGWYGMATTCKFAVRVHLLGHAVTHLELHCMAY